MMSSVDSMDYEHARNLTLLFFFERLVDKNEPRTLHDLSCQFGAPGFTKEMRQIAGGSQSGELKLNANIFSSQTIYTHNNTLCGTTPTYICIYTHMLVTAHLFRNILIIKTHIRQLKINF
jgi:hypothetical protein